MTKSDDLAVFFQLVVVYHIHTIRDEGRTALKLLTLFGLFTLITLFILLNLLYTAKTLACTIIYKCTYCEIFEMKN